MAIKTSIWEKSFPRTLSVILSFGKDWSPLLGCQKKCLNHNFYSFLQWNFRKMAKYAWWNMDPNLMGLAVHYIGTWIPNLALSLGPWAIFHPEKIYWAWPCARQCARCEWSCFFPLGHYSPWQLFYSSFLLPASQSSVHPLLSHLMTFLLISLRKQELSEENFHSFY